jgi:nitrate/nitrite transport system substrate-binding protein
VLARLGALACTAAYGVPHARARSAPEKDVLKFGFIKLTDCVPLIIAHEKQFFDDEGLLVALEAQANW